MGWRLLAVLAMGGMAATGLAGCSSSRSPGANLSVFHLRPGQCILPPAAVKAELSSVKVVSCRTPHTGEVYSLVKDPGGDNYPGTTALQSFANGACLDGFSHYVGVDYRDSSLFFTYLLPTIRSWSSGDHTIDCVATTTGRRLTSSVRGSKL